MTIKKACALLLTLALGLTLALALTACGNGDDGYTTTAPTTTQAYEPTTDEYPPYENGNGDFDEFSPVWVNGENIPGVAVLRDEDLGWPTHVALIPVAQALGVDVDWNNTTNKVTLQNLGDEAISFVPAEGHDSVVEDGELFVPYGFFRDPMGAASVSGSSGEVHINTHGSNDDMH